MVYELYVKLNDSTIPNKDDLIKLTIRFVWYVLQSPYVNVYKFIDFVYNTKFELVELNSVDPSEPDLGSVTFINGNPNNLRLTVKLVRWNGVNGIVFNFRTIAHELNHLLYFGLRPQNSVFKFTANDQQIAQCHRLLHAVDVYDYDEKFMVGIASKVGKPPVEYKFMVADPIKIVKHVYHQFTKTKQNY
jgi:hypothetical protein